MFYPKINSLFKREGCGPYNEELKRYETDLQKKSRKSPLILGEYACEEFRAINSWKITEKVDGTNVRVCMDTRANAYNGKAERHISFGGRTDNAQMPTNLLRYLQETFTHEKMVPVFEESNYVMLFGEGYGGKIQSGSYYRKDPEFILFDVYCSGWWLNREGVADVADKLGIQSVPVIHRVGEETWSTDEIVDYIRDKPLSFVARESHVMEGVIARSEPLMMFRKGGPIMFKLKCCDF
jgi:ATP-dependent RNA circularization protein (DNA/RNA ligase family)